MTNKENPSKRINVYDLTHNGCPIIVGGYLIKVFKASPIFPQCSGSTDPKNIVPIAPQTYMKINIKSAINPTLGIVLTKESIMWRKAVHE